MMPRTFPIPVDERLFYKEQVFHSPPFSQELIEAIRVIAPHLRLDTSDECRRVWERDQNGSCWGEYEALAPFLTAMRAPQRILELGPGLGRSVVFFSKKLGWQNSTIDVYEGDGNSTKYTVLGPRFDDSFCGNRRLLTEILAYNQITNVSVIDAKKLGLRDLPGPYDLIYSFYAIGFHWALEHFWDDLLGLMHDRTIAIFTVPRGFEVFPRMAELCYQILSWKTVWPKHGQLKLLVLCKDSLSK